MNNERKIVYMDWNTLKGIKDSVREPFVSIRDLLSKYQNDILIPYSPSHLSDLNKNYADNKDKIDSDLEFLKRISGNYIIAKYFGVNETRLEERDVFKFFHEIRRDKENEKPVSQIFDDIRDDFGIDLKGMLKGINLKSILPDTEELEKSETGKILLKQYKSLLESGDFTDLLEDVSKMNENFQNNPQDFNDLRKGLKEDMNLDPNISNWESPIQKLDSFLPKTPFGKSFSESVIEDVNRYHKEPTFFDYYLSAYNQLGLFGFRPDNLSEKNRFNNTTEDGFHSFYGAHSHIFITNDKVMYHRSKALFETFEIKAKLFKTFKINDDKKLIEEIEESLKENRNGG